MNTSKKNENINFLMEDCSEIRNDYCKDIKNVLNKLYQIDNKLNNKIDYSDLEEYINSINILIKTIKVDIESITSKYIEDSKELAETIIGESVHEALSLIDTSKKQAQEEMLYSAVEDKLKIYYLILASSIIVSFVIGYTIGHL